MIRSAKSILLLGDTHHPWSDRKALKKVYAAAREMQPDLICQVGDLYDAYSFSRFPIDPNVTTPEDEVERARWDAEVMWGSLQEAAPRARCLQILGNHDARYAKRIAEQLPTLACLFRDPLDLMFKFEGVETVIDPTEEVFLRTPHGELCIMHGHRSKLGDHARHNQMNTVCGHSHTGGVVYLRNRRGVFWELNAGWLGSEKAPVFAYGAQKRLKGWTLGYACVDKFGPRFVLLGGGK